MREVVTYSDVPAFNKYWYVAGVSSFNWNYYCYKKSSLKLKFLYERTLRTLCSAE